MHKIPYRINEMNVDNICYTDIKSNSKKTIIYLKYMDNNKFKNFVFQTPTLLSIYTTVLKNNIYELDIPLNGKSESKVNKFISFLNQIDSKVIKDAKANPKWFNSFALTQPTKYQKIIRESEDCKNGVIRLKILKTNDFNTIIQLNDKKISNTDIPKNSWVKSIIEIYAIWINENGFGLFIRPILLDFKISMTVSYNYKCLEDSEEVDDIDDGLCSIQDNSNSIFIRSENDITSTILEMPNNSSSSEINNTIQNENINIGDTTSEEEEK